MSDATVAAAASVAVAVITAVLGPAVLARYKARQAALTSARAGTRGAHGRPARPLAPARPDPRTGARLRALGLTGLASRAHRGEDAEPRVVLREAGPRAVLDRMAEIPPLSRRAVAEELYVGRWAEWGGVVRAVREGEVGYHVDVVDPGVVDSDGAAGGSDRVLARLDFAAAERPVLESLREGDRIRYAACVTGAAGGVVTLDSATITRVA